MQKNPLKIKAFIWLVFRSSVLTRDNIVRRNWKGKDTKCSFYDRVEIAQHLFYTYVVARFVGVL